MRKKYFNLTENDVSVMLSFLKGAYLSNESRQEDISALLRLLEDAKSVSGNGECEHSVLIMWVASKSLPKSDFSRMLGEIKRSRKESKVNEKLPLGAYYLTNEAAGYLSLMAELTDTSMSDVIVKYLSPVLDELLSKRRSNTQIKKID
ncbi:MAG: hypothetical protein ACRCTW_09685 [Lactococcus garvieae]